MRALALIVVVMLGCGSQPHAPVERHVAIRGMQFVPANLVIDAGDIVVWTNEDVVPHTATLQGLFDSQALAPKQQWSYVVTHRGQLTYGCSFHPTMHGTITAN